MVVHRKKKKEARQDNAFDLSGSYETVEGSQVSLSFKVINENGVHDIYVILERKVPVPFAVVPVEFFVVVPVEPFVVPVVPFAVEEREDAFLLKLEDDHKIPRGELLSTPKRFVTLGKNNILNLYVG